MWKMALSQESDFSIIPQEFWLEYLWFFYFRNLGTPCAIIFSFKIGFTLVSSLWKHCRLCWRGAEGLLVRLQQDLVVLLWTVPLVSENRTKSTRVAWEWLGNGSQSLTLFGWFISVFKGKHKAMVLLLFYLHLSNITFHKQLLFCPVWKVQLWIITVGFGFFFFLIQVFVIIYSLATIRKCPARVSA